MGRSWRQPTAAGKKAGGRRCMVVAVALALGLGLWASGAQAAGIPYDWAALLQAVAAREDPEGLLLRATAYLNLGRVAKALNTIDLLSGMPVQELAGPIIGRCRAQAEAEPADVAAVQCMAVGYYAINQLDAAIAHMRRAAELEPSNPWPLNLIAIAQLSQNDLAGAQATAERALQVDKSNQYAHLILSQVALRQRNYLAFLLHYLQAPDAAREILEYLRSREQKR